MQAHFDLGYTADMQDYMKRTVQYCQNKFNCLLVIARNDMTQQSLYFLIL